MTTNPSLMPHLSWPKKVRDAHSRFLEAQRREKESLDAMDMLSVRVGHEGPSSAQHRTFMTAEGFVLTIESEAVLDVDPQRILLEADLGQESLEMARSKRRASFRGVALSPVSSLSGAIPSTGLALVPGRTAWPPASDRTASSSIRTTAS